jgi:hypothetical protein
MERIAGLSWRADWAQGVLRHLAREGSAADDEGRQPELGGGQVADLMALVQAPEGNGGRSVELLQALVARGSDRKFTYTESRVCPLDAGAVERGEQEIQPAEVSFSRGGPSAVTATAAAAAAAAAAGEGVGSTSTPPVGESSGVAGVAARTATQAAVEAVGPTFAVAAEEGVLGQGAQQDRAGDGTPVQSETAPSAEATATQGGGAGEGTPGQGVPATGVEPADAQGVFSGPEDVSELGEDVEDWGEGAGSESWSSEEEEEVAEPAAAAAQGEFREHCRQTDKLTRAMIRRLAEYDSGARPFTAEEHKRVLLGSIFGLDDGDEGDDFSLSADGEGGEDEPEAPQEGVPPPGPPSA